MLEHVWNRAKMAKTVSQVVIATDHQGIRETAEKFGATVVMTSPRHPTGTDRISEVASRFKTSFVVNVQGDEPFIHPDSIDAAVDGLHSAEDAVMSTLVTPLAPHEVNDANAVKCVTNLAGRALYFSRQPLAGARKHLGLYVYRREFLLGFSKLPRGPLEASERLEQLRVLENGLEICVVETRHDSIGVDTEEDLTRARERAAQTTGDDTHHV